MRTSAMKSSLLLIILLLLRTVHANWLVIAIAGARLDHSQYSNNNQQHYTNGKYDYTEYGSDEQQSLSPSGQSRSGTGHTHSHGNNGAVSNRYNNYGYKEPARMTIEEMCNITLEFNEPQIEMCSKHPHAMSSVHHGVRTSLYECQWRFKYERWNCSNLQVNRSDVLGPTLRSNNRESSFIAAVTAAGIVHQITRACSSGNLTECGCDNKVRGSIAEAVNGEKWHWGGCSDNVQYGMKFSENFLDRWERSRFSLTNDVKHQVNLHNHLVGRQLVQKMMKRQCRCHGVSGSCEFKTCWKQLPKFADVGQHLKNRYDMYAVRVAKRAKRRLRRKKKTDRKVPISDSELAYVNKSPDYCVRNTTLGVFGTRDRECNATSLLADSCDLLCCGRGYNTRIENVTEKCFCKFVWCCYVKCKQCHRQVEVHTCK